jgi:hypothetical protein
MRLRAPTYGAVASGRQTFLHPTQPHTCIVRSYYVFLITFKFSTSTLARAGLELMFHFAFLQHFGLHRTSQHP